MFTVGGSEFYYFDHPYNTTRMNERTVEVSISLALFLSTHPTLEVGAVLPHYTSVPHECVDLYEEFPGVANEDVLLYSPIRKNYPLVLSISTLDHLKTEDEFLRAIKRMKTWVEPEGLLFITLPSGQPPWVGGGPWIDSNILMGNLDMHVVRMDKVDPNKHLWEEVPLHQPLRAYNNPTHFANTLWLLSYPNPLPL